MSAKRSIQYTIRAVPPEVDRALRSRARQQGRSLNEVAREALERGAGIQSDPLIRHDLDKYAGKWVHDPAVEEALLDQDRVDESLWR